MFRVSKEDSLEEEAKYQTMSGKCAKKPPRHTLEKPSLQS
jgi:hypothetical protein